MSSGSFDQVKGKALSGIGSLPKQILGVLFIVGGVMVYNVLSKSITAIENLTGSKYDVGLVKKVEQDGVKTTRYGYFNKSLPERRGEYIATITMHTDDEYQIQLQKRIPGTGLLPLPDNMYAGVELSRGSDGISAGMSVSILF